MKANYYTRYGRLIFLKSVVLVFTFIFISSIAHSFVVNPNKTWTETWEGLYSTQIYQQITLDRVNYHRQLAGLPLVSLNQNLSQAAQAHADYLNLNNYAGHDEIPNYQGYTGSTPAERASSAGYNWASVGEVISFGYNAQEGVDALIMAIYHRFIILNPDFVEMGVGDASHPTYGRVQVILFGRQKTTQAPQGIIGVYPGDGQKGVLTFFNSDLESPDPVAGKSLVGYPISIHFSKDFTISNPSFSVYKDSVELSITTVNSSATNPKAFSVIPLDKLEPNTTYQAEFSAIINDQIYNKVWLFDTVVSDTLKAEPSTLTILVGQTAYINLINVAGAVSFNWNPEIIKIESDSLVTLKITGLKKGEDNVTITDKETNNTVSVKVIVLEPNLKSYELSVKEGWNLLSSLVSIDLTKQLNESFLLSIWKWKSGESTWAVRLPPFSDKGISYATQKGFGFLDYIGPGEGFWVNSDQVYSLLVEGIEGSDPLAVVKGWNLLGLKVDQSYGIESLIAGKGSKINSVWKWVGGTWQVYIPSQADKGASYANLKGFGLISTIFPGEGFWINAAEGFEIE